jgi:branched-chain amino acid aminotransferase
VEGSVRYWVGENLVDEVDALVSVLDHGFTVADGVFETLKVVEGAAFALTRHLERLHASALAMELPPPDAGTIRHAVHATIAANAHEISGDARLRITYTAGIAPLGSDRGDAPPTLVVAVSPMVAWPPTAAVKTVDWPRNERGALVGVKSTSYAENVLALAKARKYGASEAIMADTQGRLCEGTGSNIFIVLDGELITPSLQTGCLPGITRALVLEWSDAQECDVSLSDLAQASEIFLTSSTRDVQPVHRCDERQLDAPGPITAVVQQEYARQAAANCDP